MGMQWDGAWQAGATRVITRQQALHSSSDEAFLALESYGRFLSGQRSFMAPDDELEQGLLLRQHPLIDLGLAKNASNPKLLAQLYHRAQLGTGDAAQDRAVRLACLSNRVAAGILLTSSTVPGVSHEELRRLALEGDADEVRALFGNPAVRGVLRDLYRQVEAFAGLDPNRWAMLVRCTAGNAALNRDDSDEHGPDLTAWDLQDALFEVVRTAPVTEDWVLTLLDLLLHVNPEHARARGGPEAAREALDRWKGLLIPRWDKQPGEQDGTLTRLSMVEELRCLIGALYGRQFANGKFVDLGTLADEDVARRCVAYANGRFSPEQMYEARDRDDAAFTLAALFNNELLRRPDTREVLREMLWERLEGLYERRCAQLKLRPHGFSQPSPEDAHSRAAETAAQAADAGALEALASVVRTVQQRLEALSKTTVWGLVILGAILLFRH